MVSLLFDFIKAEESSDKVLCHRWLMPEIFLALISRLMSLGPRLSFYLSDSNDGVAKLFVTCAHLNNLRPYKFAISL